MSIRAKVFWFHAEDIFAKHRFYKTLNERLVEPNSRFCCLALIIFLA